MKKRIAVVVVTYNRKKLLINCLNSIVNQKLTPDVIYIIDNCSTDLTEIELLNNGFIMQIPFKFNEKEFISGNKNSIIIKYFKKNENDGGAGGFNFGINKAFIDGYDWIWVMDDDGIPEYNCLYELIKHSKYGLIDYIAPNLINFENNSHFAAKFINTNNNIINYYGGPFNGILISKYLISKIGLPMKEFFIWGDETEFRNRIIEKGFVTITVKTAIHKHKDTGFNIRNIPRAYYLSRNLILCGRLFKGVYRSKKVYFFGIIFTLLKYIIYSLIYLKFSQLKNIIYGVIHGFSYDIEKLKGKYYVT